MSTGNPDGVVKLPAEVAADLVEFTLREGEENIKGLVSLIVRQADQLLAAKAMADAQEKMLRQALSDSEQSRACMQTDLNLAKMDYDELAKLARPGLELMLLALDLVGPEGVTAEGAQLREQVSDMIAELVAHGY